MILLGSALVLSGWPWRAWSRLAVAVLAVSGLSLSVLTLIDLFTHHALGVNSWFIREVELVGAVSDMRMSPASATCYLLASIGVLLRLRRAATLTGICGTAVILIGWSNLMGYWFNVPLLYEGNVSPMSLLSAWMAMILGAGLVAGAGLQAWPLSVLAPVGVRGDSFSGRLFSVGTIAVFLLFCLMIGTAGYPVIKRGYYESQKRAWAEIGAVADLKVRQISEWYGERMADARFIQSAPWLTKRPLAFTPDEEGRRQRDQVLRRMTSIKENLRYSRVLLLDQDQQLLLAVPPDKTWVGAKAIAHAAQAMRTGEIQVADLHRSKARTGSADMDILIPLKLADSQEPVAVLELEIDPHQFLFPTLLAWPTSSRTAETLLLRRENNHFVYLNELRNQPGTVLALHVPIGETPQSVAEMAVTGKEGVVEGVDYSGAPVLAALRPVPGTPWFLVAKIDKSEVYAPLYHRIATSGYILFVLVLSAALGVGLLQRQRDRLWLSQQLASERELRESEERFKVLADATFEGIAISENCRFIDANEPLLDMLGYTREEFIGMEVGEIILPAQRSAILDNIRSGRDTSFEHTMLCKDGKEIIVEIHGRTVDYRNHKVRYTAIHNITERKRAEAAIKESEAKYRNLYASMRDAFVSVDMNGYIIEYNQAYLSMIGYTPDELRNLRYLDLTPAKWHSMEAKIVAEQVLPRGYSDTYEKEYIRKDGTVFPVELRTVLKEDPDHRPAGMWAIVRDITERKRAEAELVLSRQRMALHVLQTPLAVIEWSLDGRIQEWNPAAECMFGFTREEAAGQSWKLIVPEPMHEQMDWVWRGPLERYGARRLTHENRTKDGRIIHCEWFNTPLVSGEGAGVGMASLVMDVTDRKLAEAALRDSEEQFRALVEHTVFGVTMIQDGRFTYVNPRMAEMLGYTQEELISKDPVELVAEDDRPRVRESIRQRLAGEIDQANYVFRAVHKNGQEIWLELQSGTLMHHGRRAVISTLVDITERIRIEEERLQFMEAERAARADAERANRMKDDFLATASHELRNPLNGILGWAQLLSKGKAKQEDFMRGLDIIQRNARTQAQLVEDLLDVSRWFRARCGSTSRCSS